MLRKSTFLIGSISMLCGQLVLADASVTVAHFAPFAETIEETSVSVALNGEVALTDVKFKDFVPSIPLPAGEYLVEIILTGTDIVAMSETYMLEDGVDYTVYASGNGTLQDLKLVALVEDNTAPAMGNVKVRVIHAAPFGPTSESTEVSIRTAAGDLVAGLKGVPFGGDSGYLELPEGTYDLKVASNNGQVNYIDPLPVELPSGTIATLFAVGDIVMQDLSIVATPIAELPLRDVVDDSTNGSYMLDGMNGQGFWMTPIPAQNRVVGSWYTYNADGSPMWFTFDSCNGQADGECPTPGEFDGMTAMTTLYQSTGATENGMQMTVPVGTIDFDVITCEMVEASVFLFAITAEAGHHGKKAQHNIVDTAAGNGSFTTLVAALEAAGLVETLKGDGPFTVFAPTDEAFAKLPAGTVEKLLLPENKDQLISILTYHVVAGKVTAADVVKLNSATTVNGQDVEISFDETVVMIDGATVAAADVMASNGVIHVIDQVILPN